MDTPQPDNQQRSFGSYNWIFPVTMGISLAITGLGIFLALGLKEGWSVFAAGCISFVITAAAWPLGLSLYAARQTAALHQQQLLTTTTDRLQQLAVLIELIGEQQLLSDRAKAVAFREKDRDALRRAIQDEMGRQDWEAALALAKGMEQEFGYRQEADRFREMINERKREVTRRQVAEAITVVDRYTRSEEWSAAIRESERLLGLYPEEPQVKALPQEIESRRQAHKKRLLESWNDAVKRHDVDGGIEILRQLDLYLTPSEAESMQEVARTLFRDKLKALRDEFAKAVQEDHRADALCLAEAIVRDFPNSGIARELRDKMPSLRQRASEAAPAPVAATSA